MAELSYNDVHRAVQDATRDLRDAINRLAQQQSKLNIIENNISAMRLEIDGMRRQVNATNIQVSNMLNHPSMPSSTENTLWQQLGTSVRTIEHRLNAIQKYLQDVSEYMQLLSDQNKGEKQFPGK